MSTKKSQSVDNWTVAELQDYLKGLTRLERNQIAAYANLDPQVVIRFVAGITKPRLNNQVALKRVIKQHISKTQQKTA